MEDATKWSDTQKIIALTVVFSFITVVVVWMFYPPKGDPGAIAVLNTLVGSLGTGFGMILTYFFGSSATSGTKDKTIARMAEGVPSTNSDPAAPMTIVDTMKVEGENINIEGKPHEKTT